jgi:hypothetical protein
VLDRMRNLIDGTFEIIKSHDAIAVEERELIPKRRTASSKQSEMVCSESLSNVSKSQLDAIRKFTPSQILAALGL